MRSAFLALAIMAVPALALHGQSTQTGEVSLPREAVRAAMGYLGVPYVHGGATTHGLDCSGLVYRVLQDTEGIAAPRGVDALFHAGSSVTYPIHIGDLVFFDTESLAHPIIPSHVGIYAGNGRFIHAASEGSRTGVIVSSLDIPYYHDRFLGARRIIPWREPVLDVVLTDRAKELTTASPFPSREKMTIEVFNRMTGGGPMDLTVLRDGRQVLAARIAPGASRPAVIPLVPDAGTWDVRVSRLWKGRELERITFTVEE